MAKGRRTGRYGKMYRNTGTWADPVWSAINKIGDATQGGAWGEAEANTRESGFEMVLPTLLNTPVSAMVVHDPTDETFCAIRTAHQNATPVELLVLDGPVTEAGSHGLRGEFLVMEFPREEPLKGEMVHNTVFKLTPTANAPVWYSVST